jgi:hypothetical protein
MKQQLLPFVLNPENLPEGTDIRTIIEQSEIDYEGTLIDRQFSFTDTNKLMLDLYDFEATSISYTNNGDGTVEVTASSGNRGITGKNVWFRIYPIIGGGVYEFPIEEIEVENFMPGQQIELTGNYTLPVDDKSIEFIAIVDDGKDYVEITELNNSIIVGFEATGSYNLKTGNNLSVYPVPFADEVTFDYYLNDEYSEVSLEVYDLLGLKRAQVSNCPAGKGENVVSWRNSDIPEGSYLYILKGKNAAGQSTILYQGHLVKSAR